MNRHDLLIQGLELLSELRNKCGECKKIVDEVIGVLDLLLEHQREQAMESDIAAAIKLMTLHSRLFKQCLVVEPREEAQRSAVKIVNMIVWWLIIEIVINSRLGHGPKELLRRLGLNEFPNEVSLTLIGAEEYSAEAE